MSALTELSDELLLEIFKYIDYKDIARIAAVNKQFKAISEDDFLWNNHPNIVSVLPNENEFIELMANHKVNSKNLAKLRGAWNSYRWTVQQFPEPSKALTPPTSLISPRSIADMLVASVLSKIELFHMLDSPIAATNPFKTAVNIIKSQGWLSLFDGFGREAFLRLYYKTFIPRQYPGFDYFITWIFFSGTAFWQTRTIPDRSHIRRWLRAGLQFILRQTLARRLMRFYFARRHRNYFAPALIIGLVSVPFSAFAMRTLLGNQTPRDTFIGSMKSALTWKLWVMPLVRFSVTFGSVVLKNTVLKWYYKWRYNAQLNKERKKFLQLLDHNQTQQ